MANADKILFHPHYLGELMTDPPKGTPKGELSATCKKRLIKVFVFHAYNRYDDLENKYIKKGLLVEEDAITLYASIKNKMYYKNEAVIQNAFLEGTPDTGDVKEIVRSTIITDTKASWDLYTFWASRTAMIDKGYYWQAHGYMDLIPSAQKVVIAHCLIDTPMSLIAQEQKSMKYKLGAEDNNPVYIEACEQIQKNMTFGDIPKSERMFEHVVLRKQEELDRIHERVNQCREWMNKHLFSQDFLTERVKLAGQQLINL